MGVVEFCEIAMLVLFGASWPFNIIKSIRSRTAKGKSVIFEYLVVAGYLCGIIAKLYTFANGGGLALSTWFYLADMLMVLIDIRLYHRNRRLDIIADAAAKS